jgi:hypothetical protein
MPFLVDEAYVRTRVLPTLLGPGAPYATKIPLGEIQDAVERAKWSVQQRLSTRFTATEVKGWMGPGRRPESDLTPPEPIGDWVPTEYEDPYSWPSMVPGDGFLRFKPRLRPILEFHGGQLLLPGTSEAPVELLASWFRVETNGELVLMPSYGASALILPNLPFGIFNFLNQRIPHGVLLNYRAGMTETDWIKNPTITRLIGLYAGIETLPVLSFHINPGAVTSHSADGLSESFASGYIFKDVEERLKTEAEALEMKILDGWDGPSALVIL